MTTIPEEGTVVVYMYHTIYYTCIESSVPKKGTVVATNDGSVARLLRSWCVRNCCSVVLVVKADVETAAAVTSTGTGTGSGSVSSQGAVGGDWCVGFVGCICSGCDGCA